MIKVREIHLDNICRRHDDRDGEYHDDDDDDDGNHGDRHESCESPHELVLRTFSLKN